MTLPPATTLVPIPPGLYNAVPGYDLCTGLGSPMGTNLINALVWPPPAFTNEPAGRNVTNGASVTFTAAASSTAPLAYFWLCNGTQPFRFGGNISSTTTNTLSITAATTNNAGSYQLVASNFTVVCHEQRRGFERGFCATQFPVSPASLTLLAGSNAVFTATPGGSTPFGYQWKKNGTNFAGAGISGTNSSVLAFIGSGYSTARPITFTVQWITSATFLAASPAAWPRCSGSCCAAVHVASSSR